MKKTLLVFFCVVFALTGTSVAKDTRGKLADYNFMEMPPIESTPPGLDGSMYQAAAANTFVVGWWQFDTPTGAPTPQGWIGVDIAAQVATYTHVDGPACPGSGAASVTFTTTPPQFMWCGQWLTALAPWCGWSTLPGYGNGWDQSLISTVIPGTNFTLAYACDWDSEPGYDETTVQWWDNSASAWVDIAAVNGGAGVYDGNGALAEGPFPFTANGGNTQIRYHFVSDSGWSDEDGLWPTSEGMFKVDDIVVTSDAPFNNTETFELPTVCYALASGIWSSQPAPQFGLYAGLHSGASVVQEDPCQRLISTLWGFFDLASSTNYACGGWPLQGAVPYGPDANGLYIQNEIWSSWEPVIGAGTQWRFEYKVYRDLKLDGLIFYAWHIRTKDISGCPSNWQDISFVYYGGQEDWLRTGFEVGRFVDASAVEVQVALAAWDMCQYWCGVYGTGACHSHAPLFDQAKVVRIETFGPQWQVRHIDLFNDNFPENGGIDPDKTGGTPSWARADMAIDMLPNSSPAIVPGDSAVVSVSDPSYVYTQLNPPDDDPDPSIPPNVYCYVRVGSHYSPVLSYGDGSGTIPNSVESPDWERYPGAGAHPWIIRYPLLGTAACGPWTYHVYQCDFVYSGGGGWVPDRYCIDLRDIYNGLHSMEDPSNDGAFTPGDTIYYFFEAVPNNGPPTYFHRNKAYRLGQGASNQTGNYQEACHQPMEWMVFPDAGLLPEGDVLLVDDCDDRGGPAEVYFDWSFEDLNIMNLTGERYHGPFYAAFTSYVDIFDVMGPSSCVGNSLASRVMNLFVQIIGDPEVVYQKILWNTGNLSSCLIGDGGPPNGGSGPEKSDDWSLLHSFMTNHPNNPGVAIWGDDVAEEWSTLTGPGAVAYRGNWMSHILVSGNHVSYGLAPSEAIRGDCPPSDTPYIVFDRDAVGPYTDYWVAYGGCPLINDFDVTAPTGPPCYKQAEYAADGSAAVLAQLTPTVSLTDARCVLSGHAFNYIRDEYPTLDNPPHGWADRTEILQDILTWFQNTYNEPIHVDPLAFTNRLGDAYPNPFNPTTTIRYEIKEQAQVTLKIYNVAGQLVRTLVDDVQTPKEGGFTKEWNGLNNHGQPVSSGVYFYRLVTKNFSQTKKMVLLK